MKVGIIGSGPGGLISAHVLCNYGISCTVFEKGKQSSQSSIAPFSVEEMDKRFKDKGVTVAFGTPRISYVEGECVGGGSEVNSGLYHDLPKEIFERWDIRSFTYGELKPYMDRCARMVNVTPIPFEPPLASQKLQQGADALGWSSVEVPRWYKYTSKVDRGVNSGIRQSMTEAILPYVNDKFFNLKTECNVQRLRKTSDGKVLVEYVERGMPKQETFDHIFVAAGAIGTPYLLLKSHLGNRKVGKTLRLHPTIKITARFKEKVNFVESGVPIHQVKEFSPDFSFGCSISNLPYLGVGLLENGVMGKELMENWRYMATYYAMVSDGIGQVRHIPFINRPLVSFKIDQKGIENLSRGVHKLGELLFAAGAKRIYPSISGIPQINNIDELKRQKTIFDPADMNLMTIHLMGSCPMGSDSKNCVVDENGILHGESNIHIADASLIPSAIGVNPQGTLMAICFKLAEDFAQKQGFKKWSNT